ARWAGSAVPLPDALWCVGFDAWPAQRADLLRALESAGVTVVHAASIAGGPSASCAATATAWATPDDELHGMAAAVRHLIDTRPDARIGVVVPDLAARRDAIARALGDALDAPDRHGAARPRAVHVNISAPPPLRAAPLVAAALVALDLSATHRRRGRQVDLAVLSAWLRGPFSAGAEREAVARARFDRDLRDSGSGALSLAALRGCVARPGRHGLAQLAALLARLAATVDAQATPARVLPSTWAERLSDRLAATGWPGERALSSAEFQTFDKWQDTLAALAQFDALTGPIGLDAALTRLRALVADTPFQPESTADAPVQVLGVLEAGGLDFDVLFAIGLDDSRWPPPARPDPWLPYAWQHKVGVPGATPDAVLAQARRITDGWRGAAPDVRFGFARSDHGALLRPSALIAPFVDRAADAVAAAAPRLALQLHGAHVDAERIDDDRGAAQLPVVDPTSGRPARLRGGTRVFTDQIACAFRGHARHRLRADGIAVPAHGIDDRTRGRVVHDAFARLWNTLGSRAGLIEAIASDTLAAHCDAAAGAAVDALVADRPDLAERPGLAAAERERVARLIARVAAVERDRAPFAVVATERTLDIEVAGVRVRGRVDRLDRIDDDHAAGAPALAIIDYKTARVLKAAVWDGDRPDDPQLPLYALQRFDEGEPAAIAFLQASPKRCGFVGRAADPAWIPDAKPPRAADTDTSGADAWTAQRAAWEAVLVRHATAFAQGVATVDPKHPTRTCAHCDLHALCRVRPSAPDDDDDDDDDAAADRDVPPSTGGAA
nr:PD-(D/E)XK nuclease family protein [Burkholderiales bacterium]